MIDTIRHTPERRLWADVALLAIMDHAKRIHAEERGLQRASHDRGMMCDTLQDRNGEIASARWYFSSQDWREVASYAGIDPDPERALLACMQGPVELRRITYSRDYQDRGRR